MIVYDDPQAIADWVCGYHGYAAPTVDSAVGFVVDGQLVAGVYFENMTPNNIFAHITSVGGVLPKSLLAAVAHYVYVELDLERMTFAVPSDNAAVVSLVRGMGAEREATLERAFGDADMDLYVLWRGAEFAQRMLRLTRGFNVQQEGA